MLVTGASGFLGGALTKALILQGETVRILSRKTSNLSLLEGLPLDVVCGNLEDKQSLAPAVDGVNVVYHCAALATDWAPWEAFQAANVLGVRNLLEVAHEAGTVQRFLHVSTSDVYGYPVQVCDESHPITLTNMPYQRSKGLGENTAWEFARDTGLPLTVIRPVSIYGGGVTDFVAEIAELLFKRQMVLIDRGRHRAGLLYLDNAVEGIIQAAASPRTIGKAYNLRDESEETWGQYVLALANGLGVNPPWIRLPGGVSLFLGYAFEAIYGALRIRTRPLFTRHAVYVFMRDQGYPIARAQEDFGFRSNVCFDEGMRRTLAWLDSEEGRRAVPRT